MLISSNKYCNHLFPQNISQLEINNKKQFPSHENPSTLSSFNDNVVCHLDKNIRKSYFLSHVVTQPV